jgi:hypothetical protein
LVPEAVIDTHDTVVASGPVFRRTLPVEDVRPSYIGVALVPVYGFSEKSVIVRVAEVVDCQGSSRLVDIQSATPVCNYVHGGTQALAKAAKATRNTGSHMTTIL